MSTDGHIEGQTRAREPRQQALLVVDRRGVVVAQARVGLGHESARPGAHERVQVVFALVRQGDELDRRDQIIEGQQFGSRTVEN
jgi:hypothetical protein